MILSKLIIVEEKEILDFYMSLKSYSIVDNDLGLYIYTLELESEEWTEREVLVYSEDTFYKTLDYVFENYQIDNVTIAWKADIVSNIDLKHEDVILPNTFLKWWENPIFLDNTIWENYDLKVFWLVLNWVCDSDLENNKDIDFVDISDNKTYDILRYLHTNNLELLEKTIVLKIVWNYEKVDNLYNVTLLLN